MPRSRKPNGPPIHDRAAQYVRMSTENQKYSIDNQTDAIREFAQTHGYLVVRTYSDPGRSGLTLKDRPGLLRLLADVQTGETPFSKLLVYDVSRWGRFQEPDEGAAYEHICRAHGVEVIYCVESFDNTGGTMNSLMKHMKRTMAAEYSRDLSMRIGRAKVKIAGFGYWVGAPAPYGYERWAVAPDGRRMKLEPGESKHALNWRTTLEPGPPEEVALVRRIFRLFVHHGRTLKQLADVLQSEGWPTRMGNPWKEATIRHVLLNPVYAGTGRYHRTSRRLLGTRVRNDSSRWVMAPNAFPAIISQEMLDKAAARFVPVRPSANEMTDAAMIDALTGLLRKHGRLGADLIAADQSVPSLDAYRKRFGSTGLAFDLAGYRPGHYPAKLEHRRKLRALRVSFAGDIRLGLESAGSSTEVVAPDRFVRNGLVVATCAAAPTRRYTNGIYWDIHFPVADVDIVVAARLGEDYGEPLDYWVIPRREFSANHTSIGPDCKSARFAMFAGSVDEAAEKLAKMLH